MERPLVGLPTLVTPHALPIDPSRSELTHLYGDRPLLGPSERAWQGVAVVDDLAYLANLLPMHVVEAVTDASTRRRLDVGSFLVRQGDPGGAIDFVVEGAVDVVVHNVVGKELMVRTLVRGDTVGELTLLGGEPRTASVRVSEPTIVRRVTRDAFVRLAGVYPVLGLWLAEVCAAKARALSGWTEAAVFDDVLTRVTSALVELASDARDPSVVVVTQQALADRLGVTRESVNKNLKKLETDGLLQLGRGRIVVTNRAALAARASSIG